MKTIGMKLKRLQNNFNKISFFLMEDDIIKEELFSKNIKSQQILKWINILLSIIVLIPLIYTVFKFSIPNILKYLASAIGVLIFWSFKVEDGFIFMEFVRFLSIFQIILHSVLGGWLQMYSKFEYHDELLHITGGMWLFMLVLPFVFASELKNSRKTGSWIIKKIDFYSLSLVNLIGVMWEIGEFTSDLMFQSYPGYSPAQEGSLVDTMTDMIFNNMGAIIGIILLKYFLSKLNKSSGLENMLERISSALIKSDETYSLEKEF